MKRLLIATAVVALVVIASLWIIDEWRTTHRTVADSSYEPSIRAPLFHAPAPLLLFDEAHRNRHRLNETYAPFLKLATAAGVKVEPLREPATPQSLQPAAALMIVTAQGPADPGDQPAFTSQEIAAIRDFVANGGGLILIVDHYPFADAAQGLADTFGVELSRGMTFDAEHADKSVNDESQLVFSRANGLLAAHPVTRDLDSVVIFTGASMSVPHGATGILMVGDNATDLLPSVKVVKDGSDTRTIVDYPASQPARGRALGVVLEHGRGRVAIIGDSAMLTAQYDRKTARTYGFTSKGFDNERFALNLLRWVIGP